MFGEKNLRKCCNFVRLSTHRVRDFADQKLKLTCEGGARETSFCVNLALEVLKKTTEL